MAEGFIDRVRQVHESIWDINARTLTRGRAQLLNATRVVYAVFRDLADGQLTLRAMSLVYTTLLSMAPLLALSFSVLKALGAHNQVKPLLFNFLAPLGDKGVEIGENVMMFVENIKVGVLGSVGLGLLVYTVISLMQKIESSFNFIWHINRERSMGERFRDYLSVIVIGPVLIVSALGISASMMSSSAVQNIAVVIPYGLDLVLLITKLLPYAMIIAAFTFIYLYIPNTKVRLYAGFTGALVSGVLWHTVGMACARFAVSSAKYDAIYSGFAIMILLLIWLYLCWLILLIGSNVSYYVQHPTRAQIVRGQFQLNNREKEQLALTIMLLVCMNHVRGRQAWSTDELTLRLGVTGEAIDYVLDQMEKLRLVAALAGEPTRFVPGRDPETISVAEFFGLLRRAEKSLRIEEGREASAESEAAIALSRVDSALDELWREQSLKDLALQVE